jgi:hypothetical protein
MQCWVPAGTLEASRRRGWPYAAAVCNGLFADDGQRQVWATIRGRLNTGPCGSGYIVTQVV